MQTTNPIGSPQGRFDDSFGELRSYFWRAASLETDSPESQRDKRKNSIMPDDSDEPGRGQAESSTSSSQTTPTKKRGRVSFMDDVVPDESTPISEEQEREFERLLKNQENKVNQIYRARSGSSVAAPFLPESPLREDGNIENDFAFRARNLRRQTIASGNRFFNFTNNYDGSYSRQNVLMQSNCCFVIVNFSSHHFSNH